MGVIKYIFVAAYVIFVLAVGLRSRKDTVGGGDSYLLGGRSIGPVITSFSFAATYISGVCMVNAGKIGWASCSCGSSSAPAAATSVRS